MRFIWMHLEVGALCGLLCGSPLSCEYEHACIVGVCQAADYTHLMCSLFSPLTPKLFQVKPFLSLSL